MGGGLGGFITDVMGGGNDFQAKAYQLNGNAYDYGGQAGGAAQAANQQGNRAQQGLDQSNQMFQAGNQMLDQSNAARGQQMGVANMMLARAQGQVPSIAQQQGQVASNQLAAQQASAAASARGPAALALAQQNAAANTATGQAQIGAQSAVAAAQERQQAEQNAMGAFSNIRGGDQGAAGMAFGAGAQQGAQAQGWAGLQNNINQSQLNAQQNKEAQNSSNYNAAQSINAQVAAENAQTNQSNGMGAITSMAALAAFSDKRTKEGVTPVSGDDAVLAPSTMGTGKGTTAGDLLAWQARNAANAPQDYVGQYSPPSRAQLAASGGGGFAVPGLAYAGPNGPKTLDAPLVQANAERSAYLHAAQDANMDEMARTDLRAAKDAAAAKANEPPPPQKKVASPTPPASAVQPTAAKDDKKDKAAPLLRALGSMQAGSYSGGNTYSAPALLGSPSYEFKSDRRAKGDIVPLSDLPNGDQLRMDDAGAYYAQPKVSDLPQLEDHSDAMAAKAAPSMSLKSAMKAPGSKPVHKMSADELSAWADQQLANTRAQTAAIDSAAPSVNPGFAYSDERAKQEMGSHSDMAAANRAQKGFAYRYKPEFTPPEQAQGEQNVGPMAQNLASDPIARTAVKKDPNGLLQLDVTKLSKLHSAGIASLQEQNDSQQRQIDMLASRLRKRGGQ